MDFDHIRGKKLHNVAWLVNVSERRLLEEIAKCDLVCANCHRIRTARRGGWFKMNAEIAQVGGAPVL